MAKYDENTIDRIMDVLYWISFQGVSYPTVLVLETALRSLRKLSFQPIMTDVQKENFFSTVIMPNSG